MTRSPFLTLALAATLLCPIAAFADDAPAPATPAAVPAAPAPAPKPHNNVRGKITAVDGTKITIETRKRGTMVVTLLDGAKIYKATDQRGQPTGAISDLTVGLSVNAHLKGAADALTSNEVHIQAPRQGGGRNKPAGAAAPVSLPAVP